MDLLRYNERCTGGSQPRMPSNNTIKRLMARNGMHFNKGVLMDRGRSEIPAEKVEAFYDLYRRLIGENNMSKRHIYNMDETSVIFGRPPRDTWQILTHTWALHSLSFQTFHPRRLHRHRLRRRICPSYNDCISNKDN